MRPKPRLIDYDRRLEGYDLFKRDLAEWIADANLEAAERIERALRGSPPPAGYGVDDAWVHFSWVLLAGSLAAWPISALTFAADEPQTVLGLSWAAITIGALGNVIAARVQRAVRNGGQP